MQIRPFISILLILFALFSCRKEAPLPASPEADGFVLKVPQGFPQPDIPKDNLLSSSRVALGRRLFYDPVLSRDSTRSCASCHFAGRAFSDSTAVSFGIEGRAGVRNSPMLANVAYQKKLLREANLPTLEMQVLVPIQEHNEFDFNLVLITERLRRMPEYVDAARQAYGRDPDPFVVTRAIAAFERTLLSGDSPWDQWFFQGKTDALTESAQRGYDLFRGERLNCSKCHEGFLFTNQQVANNGLYEVYPDSGRMRLTGLEIDRAMFKIPSLRQVAVTAPYMHDGSLPTLAAVIDHYDSGGYAHPNKSPLVRPLGLSAGEKADLLAFLHALTDTGFLTNPDFRAPE